MTKLRAPTANGEVLAVPDFDAVPALVEANRRKLDRTDVTIGGLSLRDLRALARREVLELAAENEPAAQARAQALPLLALRARDPDAPLILAGHQPELSHPGVWVKNFALNGLAKKLSGIPLNLIVDNDTLKSASLRLPVLPPREQKVHLESVAFDTFAGEAPYEDRLILNWELFRSLPLRTRKITTNWGYEPLLDPVWKSGRNVGVQFSTFRVETEKAWGCDNLELAVSRLSHTEAFALFARHILGDLPRFREVYNAAIHAYRKANGVHSKNHPAPELAEGEAPFWVRTTNGRRAKATAASDVKQLRPRALTLTLFARVCLGDFFIHGIGGGKYDEVTDAIIRDYFGIDPPAYQVLSATLHLPLPAFPSTPVDLKRAEWLVRDLHWNPDRHLSAENFSRPEVEALVTQKAMLVAGEPFREWRENRRNWFRSLQEVTAMLRPFVAEEVKAAEVELERVRVEVEANAVLQRRDYSWVLYPEEVLRPFLQRFLNL